MSAVMVQCRGCRRRLADSRRKCPHCQSSLGGEGAVYWVTFRDQDGRKRHRRIGPSRKAAVHADRKIRSEVTEGRWVQRVERDVRTVGVYVESIYRAWCEANHRSYRRGERYLLDRIVEDLGPVRLADVTAGVVESAWRSCPPYTHNRLLACMAAMLTNAGVASDLRSAPRRPEACRMRYLSPDEEERLLAECRGELGILVRLMLGTGMRLGEAAALEWGEVDLHHKLIHVLASKSGRSRTIPIRDDLAAELASVVKTWPGPVRPGAHRRAWTTATKRAGLDGLRMHDLRHTYASRLVAAGAPIRAVQELLGHQSIRMTERYAHLSPSHLRAAVDLVPTRVPPGETSVTDAP